MISHHPPLRALDLPQFSSSPSLSPMPCSSPLVHHPLQGWQGCMPLWSKPARPGSLTLHGPASRPTVPFVPTRYLHLVPTDAPSPYFEPNDSRIQDPRVPCQVSRCASWDPTPLRPLMFSIHPTPTGSARPKHGLMCLKVVLTIPLGRFLANSHIHDRNREDTCPTWISRANFMSQNHENCHSGGTRRLVSTR